MSERNAQRSRTRASARGSLSAPAVPKAGISKGGSSEFAYQVIRAEIVSLALAPGSDLDEAALVSRLGLSRTPLREALVQILPNRGTRVAPMGWNDIREHLEAFDLSQRLVTRWAALRRTEAQIAAIDAQREAFEAAAAQRDSEAMLEINWRFHAAIAACCRNSVVERFYLQLLTTNLRISRLAMTYDCFATEEAYDAHIGNIIREHREMVEAIRARDADRADALGSSHAGLARKRVSECLTQSMLSDMELPLGGAPDSLA
ncbi:GntR family transcriptional regulator [Xanthobacter flavus]|uniref:GntR family transcriptional regulator n=1 Tax=Xanthobacter flavus TaxID=281 RepID=UPI001AE8C4C0|nr:GntR family transcriptional regulator [Xanthobacter flavus]MBP2151177.1 DNA-binding GntR family transcriptional regulator [Xanthobacter flavus]